MPSGVASRGSGNRTRDIAPNDKAKGPRAHSRIDVGRRSTPPRPLRDESNGSARARLKNWPAGKVLDLEGDEAKVYACEMCYSLEDVLGVARAHVTRELTSVEREKYLHQAQER